MIVPSIGTSIVAFKLICARLQLHAQERANLVWPVLLVLGIPAAL